MATYIFQKIAKQGSAAGIDPGTEDARDWYRDSAQQVKTVNSKSIITQGGDRLYNKLTIKDVGRMYMFQYDPKTKEKLPYYDTFPLIFVMEKYGDGFLGMNLHYLPPIFRARLMDRLYDLEMNDTLRESKKLRMTYGLLAGVAKYKYFRPTIKRYLNSHTRSRFLYVPAEEWDIALMLPTERFKKGRKNKVWKDSRELITG